MVCTDERERENDVLLVLSQEIKEMIKNINVQKTYHVNLLKMQLSSI